MAYTDYDWDPTAEATDNLISEEVQDVDMSTTIAVYPNEGCFFGDFGLVVETKTDDDTDYTEIDVGTDYVFSPLFQAASAKASRKRVFSYILLKPSQSDVTSVRLTYQCIGTYQDDQLLAEINNLDDDFDQTSIFDWTSLLLGSGVVTGAVTRDPELKGQSLLEILSAAVNKIVTYMENNMTNGVTLAQDLARLETRVGGSYTKAETEENRVTADYIQASTVETQNYAVYSLTDDYCYHEGTAIFIGDDGTYQSIGTRIVRSTSAQTMSQVNAVNSSAGLITMTMAKVGDNIQITVTTAAVGTLYYKVFKEVEVNS